MASTSALRASAKATRGMVGEIITETHIDALNRSLAEHGVDASQIITILEIPAQPIANAIPARFRILYRAA
jgi:hypothetical protein